MNYYKAPLSIVFLWHPNDKDRVRPFVEYCYSLLSRDISKPFSRSMNLPVFFRTSCDKNTPVDIDYKSEKTIVFVFFDINLAVDGNWISYIKTLYGQENINIVLIAMDERVLKMNEEFGSRNAIRAFSFEKEFEEEYMFLSVAHEIYRLALNESYEMKESGEKSVLKIFLSHAKDGKNGIKLARSLKNFIDNSSMENFFDATDIKVGEKFDTVIIDNIKKSTVLAIHSDLYSSRYWCQREILCAKEYNRPIIAVDILEEYEDRRFPFATNVPGIHVNIDEKVSEKDMLRILRATLLETIRFFYSKMLINQYKETYIGEIETEIRSRPPEVSDIEKIFYLENNEIKTKCNHLIYPEPPLYSEELSFLSKLGIKVSTPLTIDLCSLRDVNIGISISEPSQEELINLGQDSNHLAQLAQDMARHLLAREAVLIYGGDLRENGFTEFLFEEAQALKIRINSDKNHVVNYIAWPIYTNDTEKMIEWKLNYTDVAIMNEVPCSKQLIELIPGKDTSVFIPPSNSKNLFLWSKSLTEMREKMIVECDVRICAGGKYSGYKGLMPGVLEEIIIAIKSNCPIFLLGGFGGVTDSVCQAIVSGEIPEKLSLDWQLASNENYEEILELYKKENEYFMDPYNSVHEILKFESLKNGLSKEENIRLFKTPYFDEALTLIFKGLSNIQNNGKE